METAELLSIIANGEDSAHQFKANIKNTDKLASEMAAFSNSKGGYLLIGVNDDGSISGLSEELQRMFQESAFIHADETPVHNSSIADVDIEFFAEFYTQFFGEAYFDQDIPSSQLLENMNLMKAGRLNLSGALLFAKQPQMRLPLFIVKAVAFHGRDITDVNYIDSQDLNGKLSDLFRKSLSFMLGNIHHRQNAQSINSLGVPEIPRIVLEELIANALIHRDYFVSAAIRILVFSDRVEIISPGHLPNNLTIENIKLGNSNVRNPILASFAPRVLPYQGLGSGILRALKAYPHIDFINDREGNTFKVIIRRKVRDELS